MYIMDLLTPRMPELANPGVILARHVWNSKRKPIQQWIGTDREKFELWQGRQKAGDFDDCEYVVSFVGLKPGTRAQFVGVYHNASGNNPRRFMDVVQGGGLAAELCGVTPREVKQEQSCFYDLRRVQTNFTDLEGRVIIEWANPGKRASQTWAQSAHNNKEVVEILRRDLASTINFVKSPA